MYKLDAQEYCIVRQLIRDPRSSDNKISRMTRIPLRTVNRKRKALEEKGMLSYFTYLHTFKDGMSHFNVRSLLTIKMRYGITRNAIISIMDSRDDLIAFNSKHIFEFHIGESDGHIVLVLIIESMQHGDIVEILNAETIPNLNKTLGKDSVVDISVIELTSMMRLLHNYMPGLNMDKGKISDTWDNKFIYIT